MCQDLSATNQGLASIPSNTLHKVQLYLRRLLYHYATKLVPRAVDEIGGVRPPSLSKAPVLTSLDVRQQHHNEYGAIVHPTHRCERRRKSHS